jgi:hypothetical protein
MSFRPILEGWDISGRLKRRVRKTFTGIGLNNDVSGAHALIAGLRATLAKQNLDTQQGRVAFADAVAQSVGSELGLETIDHPLIDHCSQLVGDLVHDEGWFALPDLKSELDLTRSELWELEDQLKRVETILNHLPETKALTASFVEELLRPLIESHPQILMDVDDEGMVFETHLIDMLRDLPETVEHMVQLPFAPGLDDLAIVPRLRNRLEYNLQIASGGAPGDASSTKQVKLPTRQTGLSSRKLIDLYLGQTPIKSLFDYPVTISLPMQTRFEHMHIVAGSGHGKTQTLQHLILEDLDAVSRGEASIVVIDSQTDLINTIAGLDVFAPGGSLDGRLVHIDPTDIEWPVALNLFDVGMDRLDAYSQLDRERLTNSILELYDFVLGSLLDAGMTQKQTVIFRYITRLLLHIPSATIHTLRELLEDGGYERYRSNIAKLQGSAKAFFENEFNGREFVATKRQVLRRLYGILENQTFERMFSHPKSKLDLFMEMNAGKVILINTAKDLLKENGTEIFGRFFIAMIAQAAQERAVLNTNERLPTFVYIDEANDYFDRNIAIILSQARKYNIGMVLAHQFLGQLDSKLHEAIAANTSIKFAGGVSAKDARALASDLRTDAAFIENQNKLSFAAFIKGQTQRAVSLSIQPGLMEDMERMSEEDRETVRDKMREDYAVHYTQLQQDQTDGAADPENPELRDSDDDDNDEPLKW